MATSFVGTEYLIAMAFLYSKDDQNQRAISFEEINKYEKSVMEIWEKDGTDALISGSISSAIEAYKNYFNIPCGSNIVALNENISFLDLKYKFEPYLAECLLKGFERARC